MAEFEAALTGAQEVPPVTTSAIGLARLSLDPTSTVLRSRLVVRLISGLREGHIHLGRPGQNGPVVAFLYGPSAPMNFGAVSELPEAVVTAASLTGPLAGRPLSDLVREMLAGNTYVNLHTVQNPNGEIRGQITRIS